MVNRTQESHTNSFSSVRFAAKEKSIMETAAAQLGFRKVCPYLLRFCKSAVAEAIANGSSTHLCYGTIETAGVEFSSKQVWQNTIR